MYQKSLRCRFPIDKIYWPYAAHGYNDIAILMYVNVWVMTSYIITETNRANQNRGWIN